MNSSSSNDFTSSILESSDSSVPDIFSADSFTADSSSSSTSSSSGGFLETLQNISGTTWLLIILILAFLGFNIFIYLAKGTQEINSFFAPLLTKIAGLFGGDGHTCVLGMHREKRDILTSISFSKR